jgi:hypothetical protein
MWSELFDIDSPARPGFDGQERRSWSWHRCPLGPSEAVFRGLAAVCGQRSGLERAVSLPSDEAKAAFLHQHMSLRFRYRLRWTAWRYGAVYDGLEPTFLVEVLTRTFLKSFVCSLDPKQLAYNVRKWRNLVLEELDEVYPDSPYNLLLVGSLGKAMITARDSELFFWVHHQEIQDRINAERAAVKRLFARPVMPLMQDCSTFSSVDD